MSRVVKELQIFLYDGPLNLLLLCIPVTFVTFYSFPELSEAIPFIFAVIALAPLAERLGFLTEQLSLHTNETIGGLLNASFGNATELLVAIIALYKKLYRLVQLSLLGSILSNMLLVLGTAFLVGGIKYPMQSFHKAFAQVNAVLLTISCMGILFPTVLVLSQKETVSGNLALSRGTAVLSFGLYIGLIYFQLFSHKHLFDGGVETTAGPSPVNMKGADKNPVTSLALTGAVIPSVMRVNSLIVDQTVRYSALSSDVNELDITQHDDSEQLLQAKKAGNPFTLVDHEEEEDDPLEYDHEDDDLESDRKRPQKSTSLNRTSQIEITRRRRKDPIRDDNDEEVRKERQKTNYDEVDPDDDQVEISLSRLTSSNNKRAEDEPEEEEDDEDAEEIVMTFTSCLVYLTVVTVFIALLSDIISSTIEKASESLHLSSIFISTIVLPINKLNLTLGIAIGSSTQIALCVLPFTVLLGAMSGLSMTLEFGSYESICLFLSVVSFTFAVNDGTSNWLMGLMLITAYVIIAMGFLVHYDTPLTDIGG